MFRKFSVFACLITLFFGVIAGVLTKDFYNFFSLFNFILFVFLLVFSLFEIRKSGDFKKYTGFFSISLTVIFLLLIFAELNYLANKVNFKYDATRGKIHSLDSKSVTFIKSLKKEVLIYLNQKADFSKEQVYAFIENVKTLNPEKVIVKNYNSALSSKFNSQSTALVGFSDKNLVELRKLNEGTFVNTLVKLEAGIEKKAFYITEIGEPKLNSTLPEGLSRFSSILEKIGYSVSESSETDDLSLADLVILAGKNISIELVNKLDVYIKNGGSVLAFFNPSLNGVNSGISKSLLEKYGIRFDENIVVLDKKKSKNNEVWKISSNNFLNFNNSKQLVKGRGVSFLLAGPVNILDEKNVQPILLSPNTSWGEQDIQSLIDRKAIHDMNFEQSGSVPLGVMYQNKNLHSKGGRFTVFGDLDWIRNSSIDLFDNGAFLNEIVDTMYEWKPPFSVQAKVTNPSFVLISEKAYFRVMFFSFFIPELLLILSLLFLSKRSSRYAI